MVYNDGFMTNSHVAITYVAEVTHVCLTNVFES